jgi:hypothetical protein
MNVSWHTYSIHRIRIDLALRLMKQDCGGGASIESARWRRVAGLKAEFSTDTPPVT